MEWCMVVVSCMGMLLAMATGVVHISVRHLYMLKCFFVSGVCFIHDVPAVLRYMSMCRMAICLAV